MRARRVGRRTEPRPRTAAPPWRAAYPADRAVLEAARELLRTGDLTDDRFAASIGALGQTRLYEVITLVGYHRLLAAQLRVLRVDG
ncbi:hypothetical protein AB0L53_06180 [Nonomuraea sp. NPDC052129]|uniref:hypothetical protein n=1 Tax=Nonomuraea sp. NPDC052129 TaxID=3154651 RepID=UPI003421B266